MKRFGQYVRELRLKRRKTIEGISSYLGIAPARVSNMEEGSDHATKNQVFALANHFDMDAKDLLIIYQQERMLHEACGDKTGEPRSCLVRSRDIAFERYRNMGYELEQLRLGKFDVRVYRPGYPVNRYIESITFYNGHHLGYSAEKVMPDGTVQLYISLDNNERQLWSGSAAQPGHTVKGAWVTGVQKQHMTYLLKGSQTGLSIRFHPGGCYALTGIPQYHLKNTVVDADMVLGTSLSRLKEAISNETVVQEIFKKTERYFARSMQQQDTAQEVVSYMCDHIFAPVPYLVRKTGYSQKHLIHMFKQHIGVTPKYFQRIRRFNKVLSNIQTMHGPLDWTGITFDNHYFDQAHFIKDFVHFAGFSPQYYLATGSTCGRLVYTK